MSILDDGSASGGNYGSMGDSPGDPMNLNSVVGGAASGAMAGASFGPYGMIAGAAIGLGLQVFGGMSSHSAAKEYNQAQQQQIQLEQQVDAQREKAFTLATQRQKLENFRNVTKYRDSALASSVRQGVGGIGYESSGAAGGKSQVTSQGNYNELGLNQNYQIGEDIFALNKQISTQRIAMAQAGMKMQSGQAYGQLGSGIMGNLGAVGRLSSGFGGGTKQQMYSAGPTGNIY